MLGLNLLVRLGRRVLAGPLADSGVLPAPLYRHLALAAMEEEDYAGAVQYLRWAGDPLLTQLLILRLRLLQARHLKERQTWQQVLDSGSANGRRDQCRALLTQEDRALALLQEYEARALEIFGGRAKERGSLPSPRTPLPTR
jgi:hypothetical protein